jgi:hypothetical protein
MSEPWIRGRGFCFDELLESFRLISHGTGIFGVIPWENVQNASFLKFDSLKIFKSKKPWGPWSGP